MRSFSLFTIMLICAAIVVVDILAFYWLQSITQLLASPLLRDSIHVLFWVFTIGLVTAIIVLKVRLDDINPGRKQLYISSFYGLTVSSFIPKVTFVVVISILHAMNFVFTEKESLVVIPLVGLLSGFLPFFIIVNGVLRTLYKFKIYSVKVPFENLPENYDGLRIVHISDMHLGSFNYRYTILEKAIKLINGLKPDIICFTGDLVNNFAWELRGWENVFKKLTAKKGKFAVLGNHDYGDYSTWKSPEEKQANFDAIKQFYDTIDFKLLLDESYMIDQNNQALAILGVENWGTPPFKQKGDLQKALQDVKEIPFKILLTHNPTHWLEEVVGQTTIALTLSGHTHGMQVGLRYKNKQWSPIKYKYKHWAGLYKEGSQYLYVNRGLGWLGLPARIGMRPEITLLELKSK